MSYVRVRVDVSLCRYVSARTAVLIQIEINVAALSL